MKNILSKLLILSIFIYLFAGFFHPIVGMDQDLGRHLLLGEIILDTKNVPTTNLFSYTYPDFPIVIHHWGSEVVLFWLFQLGGFTLLQIASTLIFVGAFSAVLIYSLRKAGTPTLAIGSILYLPILFERTDVRPELFSFLFLSLFVILLYKYRQKPTKWIFLLPLLQLLFVNMHIYALLGIFVFGLFLVDAIALRVLNRKKLIEPAITTLVLVFLGCVLVSLANPYGFIGAIYPLIAFQNYGYTIQENQSVFKLIELSYPQRALPYLVASIILLFSALLANFKRTKLIDWLLSISFSVLAFSAVRNFPLFVFATFIPLTTNLTDATRGVSLEEKPIAKTLKALLPFVLLAIILWQTQSVVSQKGFGIGVEENAKNAADFYIEQGLKGPLFNNFDIGSYLDYKFYQKERVFIDSRPGEYPTSFIQETYIPMQEDPKIFARTDEKYKFNTIFFSHTDMTPWARSFLPTILENKNWKTVYLDADVIILVKDNEGNKSLIDKFGMYKASLKARNVKKDNLQSLLKLTNFYNTVGLTKQEIDNYKDILELNPNFCPALQNLAILLSEEKNEAAPIYAKRFQQSCE